MEFSPNDEIIRITMEVKGSYIMVGVHDNGIGIPADMQDQLFDFHYSVGRSGTANEPSFGLGLYICKQIVDAHHGIISFDSDGKKGTIFYISFPYQA